MKTNATMMAAKTAISAYDEACAKEDRNDAASVAARKAAKAKAEAACKAAGFTLADANYTIANYVF